MRFSMTAQRMSTEAASNAASVADTESALSPQLMMPSCGPPASEFRCDVLDGLQPASPP